MEKKASIWIRLLGFGFAYSMGLTAALVYPPFLLILIPVGVVLVARFWWNSGLVQHHLGSLCGGTCLRHGIRSPVGNLLRQLPYTGLFKPDLSRQIQLSGVVHPCTVGRDTPFWAVDFWNPRGWMGFAATGFILKRWRLEGLLLGVLAVAGALLSLGPCPASSLTCCGGLSG